MGHVGAARRTVYCASKHAMEGFTKAMAIELAPHNIRVNSLGPTFLETPMTKPFFENKAFRDEVLSKIKLGRLGQLDGVPAAVEGPALGELGDRCRDGGHAGLDRPRLPGATGQPFDLVGVEQAPPAGRRRMRHEEPPAHVGVERVHLYAEPASGLFALEHALQRRSTFLPGIPPGGLFRLAGRPHPAVILT